MSGAPSGGEIVRAPTSGSLTRTSRSAVAPRHSTSAAIYQGSGLPLGEEGNRDECWASLGAKVKARLIELSGPVVCWFADVDPAAGDGRPEAVMLGECGLSSAKPRVNDRGAPVYFIQSRKLDRRSYRKKSIEHRAGGPTSGSWRSGSKSTSAGPLRIAAPGVPEGGKGLLGNLPPSAQELLQAPFLNGDEVKQFECWYQGYPTRIETFILIMAGDRSVTAVTGSNNVPAGRDMTDAQWSLVCHRFDVVQNAAGEVDVFSNAMIYGTSQDL